MPRQIQAIASCRVSSDEQLHNNSLNRQRESVIRSADDLGANIVKWWSGSVSSKRGANLERKDLREMIEFCKQNKQVKYLIVDEPDRFMRSIDEAAYFEVTFRQLGVQVWYASDPELNRGNLGSKLIKFTKYMAAEGSNEERQNKSIAGQTNALKEGRYPFHPKAGYMKGKLPGIPEIHPERGPLLREALKSIAALERTPQQAMKWLNRSQFTEQHHTYKMDKFRRLVKDPFYAGVVEIDKQVKYRNENGLHEALITMDEHKTILSVMQGHKRRIDGPRKNYNPEFPLSNHIECRECSGLPNSRLVGFNVNNGHGGVYPRYRCRNCNKYQRRDELHQSLSQLLSSVQLSEDAQAEFVSFLEQIWKKNEQSRQQEISQIENRNSHLTKKVAVQIDALTNPKNAMVVDEIRALILSCKTEISKNEERADRLKDEAKSDYKHFMQFALNFVNDQSKEFWKTSQENRLRCKELAFPGGISVDASQILYTNEISPIYRLATKQKDLPEPEKSSMVQDS